MRIPMRFFGRSREQSLVEFKVTFEKFREILQSNNRVLEIIGELEDKSSGEYIFDVNYLKQVTVALSEEIYRIISNLNILSKNRYQELFDIQKAIHLRLEAIIEGKSFIAEDQQVISLNSISRDDEEAVGGKNATLGEIKNIIQLLTPKGFAITVAAYHNFLNYNKLWPQIKKILKGKSTNGRESSIKEQEEAIARLFDEAQIPPELKKDINKEINLLCGKKKQKHNVVVRSSAVGEDSIARSYAGQFRSILNCSVAEVLSSYKKILSSRFQNMSYQADQDLQKIETELPMAVSVQEIIDVKTAGVAYSYDPTQVSNNCIIISAVYGLGSSIVSGRVNSDFFRVSRSNPFKIVERRIAPKKDMTVPAKNGGTKTIPLEKNLQGKSCLNDDQISRIAEITFLLDRSFKRPQDIEWAIDQNDQIVILQCRPLALSPGKKPTSAALQHLPDDYRILLNKEGMVANRGIAAGKVRHINEDTDPADFPVGSIGVAKQASPKLAGIIRKTAAIITDMGSTTGHMATIAREFGVPAIVGTEKATRLLPDGMEITVDAQENIVYQGIISELLAYEIEGDDIYITMPEYVMLRKILKKVAPLYLIDPGSKDFCAKNCRTYHDIIRFSHEKAMHELISFNISSKNFRKVKPKELKLPIPLGLKIIDVGGGLSGVDHWQKKVSLDEVRSLPMKALLAGLSAPHVWNTDPVNMGFGDLMSSITRFSVTDNRLAYQGQNLAVISDNYMNLSLRLGYHFNVVDAYLSPHTTDNYLYFRFVGGATESERRNRRAIVIKTILEKNDFKVVVRGDLVVGKIKGIPSSVVEKTLTQMGRLIGFTRQLDAKMQSDESILYYTDSFFNQNQLGTK